MPHVTLQLNWTGPNLTDEELEAAKVLHRLDNPSAAGLPFLELRRQFFQALRALNLEVVPRTGDGLSISSQMWSVVAVTLTIAAPDFPWSVRCIPHMAQSGLLSDHPELSRAEWKVTQSYFPGSCD